MYYDWNMWLKNPCTRILSYETTAYTDDCTFSLTITWLESRAGTLEYQISINCTVFTTPTGQQGVAATVGPPPSSMGASVSGPTMAHTVLPPSAGASHLNSLPPPSAHPLSPPTQPLSPPSQVVPTSQHQQPQQHQRMEVPRPSECQPDVC